MNYYTFSLVGSYSSMQEIIKNVPLFASRVHVPRRKLLKDLS